MVDILENDRNEVSNNDCVVI